jgi:hypothetical protein
MTNLLPFGIKLKVKASIIVTLKGLKSVQRSFTLILQQSDWALKRFAMLLSFSDMGGWGGGRSGLHWVASALGTSFRLLNCSLGLDIYALRTVTQESFGQVAVPSQALQIMLILWVTEIWKLQDFFLIPFYLQAVQIHLANVVKLLLLQTWRGVLSSTLPYK